MRPNTAQASTHLFKANNRNTRKRKEICSKLTIKQTRTMSRRRFGVFVVNFEHISHLFLVFLLLALSMYLFAGSHITHSGRYIPLKSYS